MRARWASRRGVEFWAVNTVAATVVGALRYATLWAEANAFVPAAVFVAARRRRDPDGGRASWIAGGLACAQLVFGALEPRFNPFRTRGCRPSPAAVQSLSGACRRPQRDAARNVAPRSPRPMDPCSR